MAHLARMKIFICRKQTSQDISLCTQEMDENVHLLTACMSQMLSEKYIFIWEWGNGWGIIFITWCLLSGYE